MRVLNYSGYISDENIFFRRNITGYGFAAFEFAKLLVREGHDVDQLTQSYLNPEITIDGVRILKRSILKILTEMRLRDIIFVMRMIFSYQSTVTLKRIFYRITLGHTLRELKKGKYDVIIVHGINYYTIDLIKQLNKNNAKYVIVTHQTTLNRRHRSNSDYFNSIMEKNIYSNYDGAFPKNFICVSEGIANTIREYVGEENYIKVVTINNSIPSQAVVYFKNKVGQLVANEKLGHKTFVMVGTISNNKNQKSVIEAFLNINYEIRKYIKIVFVGTMDNDFSESEFFIKSIELNQNLSYIEKLSRDALFKLMVDSNGVVMASLNEGFGLSVLEAIYFGLPVAISNNCDAASVLADNKFTYTFDPENIDQISESLIKLFYDKNQRDNIQKWAVEKFGSKYIGSRIVGVLTE